MIRNILLVTLRAILRDKLFSIINVLGLVLGITAFLFITMYVIDEISFDRFHKEGDRIYRVALRRTFPDGEMSYATTPNPMGETMYRDIPEVVSFTRVSNNLGEWKVENETASKEFFERSLLVVDSNFFEFFSFENVRGTLAGSLDKPRSVVLTERSSQRYFNNDDPIGKTLIMQDTIQFVVTAVVRNPDRSHLYFDFLISGETFPATANDFAWVSYSTHNYIKLIDESSHDAVAGKFPLLVTSYIAPVVEGILGRPFSEYEKAGNLHYYYLQPIKDIHLRSNLQFEITPNSSMELLFILCGVAVAILSVVCINYVNLTTAKSLKRAKEVGIRKIYGSSRWRLSLQFLLEALLFTMTGVIISLVLVWLLMPDFARLAQRSLSVLSLLDVRVIATLIIALVFVSFLSGLYPSFFVASFQPSAILKGEVTKGRSKNYLRNALVIVQFSISILLITGTITIVRQVDFMVTQDLGFTKDQVLVLERADRAGSGARALKAELAGIPGVQSVGTSFFMPGRNTGSATFEAISASNTERHLGDLVYMDYNCPETMGLELVTGRLLMYSDSNRVLVNETLAKEIGWDNPIGEKIKVTNGQPLEVVGVLKDFHLNSLREKIEPAIIFGYGLESAQGQVPNPPFHFIRIDKEAGIRDVMESVEQVWSKVVPDEEMYSFFLDSEFNKQYQTEDRFVRIFSIFSILAIAIALIGVIGLSVFSVSQRMKEISVRKVLGANTLTIIVLLTRNYLFLVVMANLLALPAGIWLIGKWLNGYPYRVELPVEVFGITLLLTLVLVVVVTLIQSVRASYVNPARSLRND